MKRIGFLYNHDVPHQIRHTGPIIGELAGKLDVWVLTSSSEQEAEVRRLLSPEQQSRVSFRQLAMSRPMRMLRVVGDRFAPFSRLAILRDNREFLAGFDALVVPEMTTTFLKSRYGLDKLKLIFVPHGLSTGAPGFGSQAKLFDLILLPGSMVRDRMIAMGLVSREGSYVVGYPKFDTIDVSRKTRFFDNDKTVVLYNPHFNPYLSSWYTMGEHVVRWFAGQDRYNLIVAPHIMLHQRHIHVSLAHKVARWRNNLPADLLNRPNIKVDFGSPACVDMTYTLSADIYLGDVSSQIYEWIVKPRPAIFLRAHGDAPAQSKNYFHWEMGQIVDRAADLPAALDRALPFDDTMRRKQAETFAENFDVTGETSGRRSAHAILEFLQTNEAPQV